MLPEEERFRQPFEICLSSEGGVVVAGEMEEKLQEFHNCFYDYYRKEVDRLSQESQIMQNVLSGNTTYQKEVESFKKVLQPSLIQMVGCLFKNPTYDGEAFNQVSGDLENLSDVFTPGDNHCSASSLISKADKARREISAGIIFAELASICVMETYVNIMFSPHPAGIIPLAGAFIGVAGTTSSFKSGGENLSLSRYYDSLIFQAEKIDKNLVEVYKK